MTKPDVRLATRADIDTIAELYESARQWLDSLGSDQWASNTPERTRPRIASSVEHGECYVSLIDGVVVGTITVDDFADPEFWHAGDDPESALYVHRMVVDRAMRGRNIGACMLDLADQIASREGRRRLRLDAWHTNLALRDYYERQGFRHVRTVRLAHRGSGALFERPVARFREVS
ncbi:GNAT family N-acetyltransferase [Asanoa iriomotensis]|uniref:GNAT family N-acetyltransferase n=1 Tax=Asanoa iriomotensis TaxID=234613 RepID=UPI00194487BB